jgi:transcriptional regulator with XRE-family HTH domain
MNSKTVTDATSLDSILELIGKKLYELRIKKGYKSHAAFAEEFDLPRIQYWRMEKGKTNITLRSLHKILDIHGITVEELFAKLWTNAIKRLDPEINRRLRVC